jgi:uncharacterized membrane protein YesL
MRFLTIVADVMIISLVWLVVNAVGFFMLVYGLFEFQFPPLWILGILALLASFGTSTSSAYYVLTRRISNREGYLLADFFRAFKANFVTATLCFLVLGPVLFITAMNVFLLDTAIFGAMETPAIGINILLFIQAVFVAIHIFPMASRFDMKFRRLFKAAFLIANKHLLTTISHAALLFALIWLALVQFPILFLFISGIYFWFSSHLLMRVYRKYRPEMDRDDVEGEVRIAEPEPERAEEGKEDENQGNL